MKIGDQNGVEPTIALRRPAGGAPPPPVRVARRADPAGETRLPDAVRALGRLVGRVDDPTPDPARAAHLALLRNAVASGRYQPDLHDVARKLLIEMAAERVR